MDYERILGHAIDVVRRHRALWILGFVWALVGGAGGGGWQGIGNSFSGNAGSGGASFDSGELPFGLGESPFGAGRLPAVDTGTLTSAIVLLLILGCLLALGLVVVTIVVRYVVQFGTLRSLDLLDRHGVEPTVRGAWSEGWSRRTWRPFLQNLIVDLPFAAVCVAALVPVAAPLLLAVFGRRGPIALGVVAACGLFCGWLLAVIAAGAVIGVLKELWWREAILDDRDFLSAIGAGWRLARANVGLLVQAWIVMFVVGIVWMLISIVVLIALGLVTALAAGLPALAAYHATDSLLVPLAVGVPIAILTFLVPVTFVQGLYLVFRASVWNQIYRRLPNARVAEQLSA